ncbi:MAG: ABC transporter ATP-binding protein [Butyrivibrio sp.]|nr:ABC transporter ATP-binding protein [Butyrivibrio sp.]
MIKVENLICGYGNKNIINDVSFRVKKGAVCGLIGANGAGKSTLIKTLMGYIKPRSGNVLLNGRPVEVLSENEIAKNVAYVAQTHEISFAFSVLDMVLMGRTPYLGGIYGPKPSDYEICMQELGRVGLSDFADVSFDKLSGGQQQLVVLARAFAQRANIFILDEPTSNLDYKNKILFWEVIRDAAEEGKTVLVSLHEPDHALWFCDEVLAIGKGGKIIANGKSEVVMTREALKDIYDCNIDVTQTITGALVTIPAI